MTPLTHKSIDLGPIGNLNGTYIFLKTGNILKYCKRNDYPKHKQVINTVKKWGLNTNKKKYGANLEFRNHIRENFEWDTDYDLDGLIDMDHGIQPEISYEFPGVLLEEDNLVHVITMDTKKLDHNAIDTAASNNSGIIHTPRVCDNSDNPNPIIEKYTQPLKLI